MQTNKKKIKHKIWNNRYQPFLTEWNDNKCLVFFKPRENKNFVINYNNDLSITLSYLGAQN